MPQPPFQLSLVSHLSSPYLWGSWGYRPSLTGPWIPRPQLPKHRVFIEMQNSYCPLSPFPPTLPLLFRVNSQVQSSAPQNLKAISSYASTGLSSTPRQGPGSIGPPLVSAPSSSSRATNTKRQIRQYHHPD